MVLKNLSVFIHAKPFNYVNIPYSEGHSVDFNIQIVGSVCVPSCVVFGYILPATSFARLASSLATLWQHR